MSKRENQSRHKKAFLDPTERFTGPFRFFHLPRELRDMVYDEVWPKTPWLHRATLPRRPSPLIDITAKYRKDIDGWTTDSHIPVCMLVSSVFLREAMEQYFREIDWMAKIPASYFTTRIYLSNLSFHEDSRFGTHWELESLLTNIKHPQWIPDADYSRIVIEVYKAWPMNLPILKKLEQGLREANGQTALFITFGVALHRTKSILRVDLSGLESIGFKLDKLVVEVICVKRQSYKRINELKPLIKTEIDRLGRALIGQSISSSFTSRANASPGDGAHWTFAVSRA